MIDPIIELELSRKLSSPAELQAFELALAQIPRHLDLANLTRLHLVLDDSTEHHEVMWGLIHLLETYDVEQQLTAFLDALPLLSERAPDWTRIIFIRALNNDQARLELRKAISRAVSVNQAKAIENLRIISNKKTGPLKERADEVLDSLTAP